MATGERIPAVDVLDYSRQLGRGIVAVLNEVLATLECPDTVDDNQIDIQSLPLSAQEREYLNEVLGRGEATIELQLSGLTRCTETAVPGVWWVTHFNPEGMIAAEFIEVAEVPHILKVDAGEIEKGIAALKRKISTAGGSSDEESNYE